MNYDIITNQAGPYEHLEKVVGKHFQSPFLKPITEKVTKDFQVLSDKISKLNKPLILDSCCGTGMSTQKLAILYPDHFVLGIDKSSHRLGKTHEKNGENFLYIRGDVIDYWRLIEKAKWSIEKHFIFYPNPYPKAEHFKRRFHGHPIFPTLLILSPYLEIRSNWKLYLEEFQLACNLGEGIKSELNNFYSAKAMTLFEKKYLTAGQALYNLTTKNTNSIYAKAV